jgi:hypothetical protein
MVDGLAYFAAGATFGSPGPCRVYQTEAGPDGAPSLAQLRSLFAHER